MNRWVANAERFLARAKGRRSLKEREAYLEGLFDGAYMSIDEQAQVEAVLFKKGPRGERI